MEPDYYRCLELSPLAKEEEIKKAYRKLAKRYHPDTASNDLGREKKFQEIQAAYAVLSDPKKRNEYDVRIAKESAASTQKKKTSSQKDVVSSDFSSLHASFESFFSDFGVKQPEKENAKDQTKNKKSAKENPLDTTALFESFFGKKG